MDIKDIFFAFDISMDGVHSVTSVQTLEDKIVVMDTNELKTGRNYLISIQSILEQIKEQENKKEVKRCPHCGGRAVIAMLQRRYFEFYQVQCSHCGCQTGEYPDPEEAVKQWNQRFWF